ncbi:unnamed protein product [Lepeophtheirus salmonis]|uniref:(salmon louse) hypothetical protein n=1 Tax=Lepeophtheirus salmonis TaxID=72036 RepID=A0A7R8H8V2_LEPSM|nr:unnamed protein product [Lepeophtheirus salmonis]CAF2937661.1 unnamed protein product [Lepeophtheirus salmonis]
MFLEMKSIQRGFSNNVVDEEWRLDFKFAIDIMEKLNELNQSIKFSWIPWLSNLEEGSKTLSGTAVYVIYSALYFTTDVDSSPEDLQLELLDLQANNDLNEQLKSDSLPDFYKL